MFKSNAVQSWILGFFSSSFIKDAILCYRKDEMILFAICVIMVIALTGLWFYRFMKAEAC